MFCHMSHEENGTAGKGYNTAGKQCASTQSAFINGTNRSEERFLLTCIHFVKGLRPGNRSADLVVVMRLAITAFFFKAFANASQSCSG